MCVLRWGEVRIGVLKTGRGCALMNADMDDGRMRVLGRDVNALDDDQCDAGSEN